MFTVKFEKIKNDEIIKTIVSFSSEEWNNIIDSVKESIGKKLKIKGFRSGNVPKELVERYVSTSDILSQAEEKGIQKIFNQLKKEKEKELEIYRLVGRSTKKISFSEFEVEFEFEKLPTIELKKYKNFDISIKNKNISENEIDNLIEQKKEKFSKLVEKGNIAKKGMFVNIDFEGFIDGKKNEKASMKNYSLELGSNTFIPGFEDGVIGMKLNENKDLKLNFPKDYSPEFAGKEVIFKILLNKVHEKVKLSKKELIEKLNLKSEEELRQKISDELISIQKQNNRPILISKINEEILKNAKIDLPKTYFERELQYLKENQIDYLKRKNIKLEDFLKNKKMSLKDFEKELKIKTENTIKELLVIFEIAKIENIDVTEQEIESYYNMLSQYTKKTVDELKQVYPKTAIYNNFLKNKVEEFLINNNSLENKKK